NSMFEGVKRMGDIPVMLEPGKAVFLYEIAEPRDAAFIQTNIVRVDGKKQVYIPVYRQVGASTLAVVDALSPERLREMKDKSTRPEMKDINLELVMDQSVYVRASI